MPKLVYISLSLIMLLLSFFSFGQQSKADISIVKNHLTALTKTQSFRTYNNFEQLNRTAEYIDSVFRLYSDSVWYQEYSVNNIVYKNVICSFGIEQNERIIIGAHYDVCGNQEGADDNASGTTGLLELARLLKDQSLDYRIDLVAFTLEEPPFFRSEYMGSYVHANYLNDNQVKVKGMICLEMIGFFSDNNKSQDYPLGFLSLVYGKTGNYITLVKKFNSGHFTKKYCRKFKHAKEIRTKVFTGPKSLQGIDFSDHLNYWKFGYPALMITDTAFYRNKNYHQVSDVMETLDVEKMSKVIDAVLDSLIRM